MAISTEWSMPEIIIIMFTIIGVSVGIWTLIVIPKNAAVAKDQDRLHEDQLQTHALLRQTHALLERNMARGTAAS